MKVSVTMRGGLEFALKDQTVEVNRIFIGEGGGEKLKPMLAVQLTKPAFEGDQGAMPGFVLIPFEGNGKHTIEPTKPRTAGSTPPTAGAGAGPTSGVRLEWWPADRGPEEYARAVKPCTVEVEDKGFKGRLQCPDMTHDGTGGPNFSLDFRWEKA